MFALDGKMPVGSIPPIVDGIADTCDWTDDIWSCIWLTTLPPTEVTCDWRPDICDCIWDARVPGKDVMADGMICLVALLAKMGFDCWTFGKRVVVTVVGVTIWLDVTGINWLGGKFKGTFEMGTFEFDWMFEGKFEGKFKGKLELEDGKLDPWIFESIEPGERTAEVTWDAAFESASVIDEINAFSVWTFAWTADTAKLTGVWITDEIPCVTEVTGKTGLERTVTVQRREQNYIN